MLEHATLATISHDLLELILSYDCISHKCVDLWKCDNARLNAALANSCTKVKLEDCKWNSTSRFPKMLRHLRRLKTLSISRPEQRFMDATELGFELQQLSPTLETLELNCAESVVCFLRPELTLANVDANGIELVKDRVVGSRFWDIGRVFPILSTLTLLIPPGTGDIDVPYIESKISNQDVIGLPQTLTSLSIPGYRHENCAPPHPACLPRNLLSLACDGSTMTEDYLRQLPPNLTRLKIYNDDLFSDWNCEIWGAMPRTLTEIEKHKLYTVVPPPGGLHLLPPNIARLRWANGIPWDVSLAISLPIMRQITALACYSRHLTLASLPSTLTELHTGRIDWNLNWPRAAWPERLKNLRIEEVADWTLEQWQSLPDTLRQLTIATNSLCDVVFPRNLKSLSIDKLDSLETFPFAFLKNLQVLQLRGCEYDPAHFARLPRGLTEVRMRLLRYPTILESHEWPLQLKILHLEMVDDGNVDLLDAAPFRFPSSLEKLEFYGMSGTFKKEHLETLPRRLKSLELRKLGAKAIVEMDAFHALPPSLTKFFCTMIPMECGTNRRRSGEGEETSWNDSAAETDRLLAALPQTLQTLSMPCGSVFLERHFLMLPKALRAFFLTPANHPVTRVSSRLLVSHLKNLPVSHSAFPQHLQRMRLPDDGDSLKAIRDQFEAHMSYVDSQPLQTPDPRTLQHLQ